MDEITLVRELGGETPLPTPDRLAAARARLMTEVAPRPAKRRLWAVLGATAAAVTATVAAVLVPASQTQTATPAQTQTATPAPEMVPVAAFLNEVATTAAKGDDVVPRGNQYIYTKSATPDGNWTEFWNSVDGRRDSVWRKSDGQEESSPGCRDGKVRDIGNAGKMVESVCQPYPHYWPDLPTDATALISWVEKRNPGENGGVNVNGVGKDLWQLTDGNWLRPAQQAALYRAVGTIDGISLVPNSKDGTGRTGTGVAWAHPIGSEPQVMWVFDTKTHVFLGGTNYSVVTPPAIVDKVGQRP
jgi:hypothetical protein